MNSLPTIKELLSHQRAFYDVLSTWEERPWGRLGINLENRGSYDSNHARLDGKLAPGDFFPVLEEVTEWYSGYGLQPRVHFYSPPHDLGLVHAARRADWDVFWQEETWRAWPDGAGYDEPVDIPGLTISTAGAGEMEGLLLVQNEGSDAATAARREQVWQSLARASNAECLLVRVDGEPAAGLACVWNRGWGYIEGVRTREQFRRQGLCTAMIRTLQQKATERSACGLYLCDLDGAPGRIYTRAGFERVGALVHVALYVERQ